MTPADYDWTRFTITFYYPVSIERAYQAWATKAGLESFFIEKATFKPTAGGERAADELIAAGDLYTWVTRHEFEMAGEVVTAQANSEIAFTFGSMYCRVAFEQVDPSTTRVFLEQTRIPGDASGQVMGHLNCRSCWIFFMTNLKSVFMNRTDLRDTEPWRASSMEVGYKPRESDVAEVRAGHR